MFVLLCELKLPLAYNNEHVHYCAKVYFLSTSMHRMIHHSSELLSIRHSGKLINCLQLGLIMLLPETGDLLTPQEAPPL